MNSRVDNDSWIIRRLVRVVMGPSQVLCTEKVLSVSNDMHGPTTTREFIRRFVRLVRMDKWALRVDTSRQYWTTLNSVRVVPNCAHAQYGADINALHTYVVELLSTSQIMMLLLLALFLVQQRTGSARMWFAFILLIFARWLKSCSWTYTNLQSNRSVLLIVSDV